MELLAGLTAAMAGCARRQLTAQPTGRSQCAVLSERNVALLLLS